MTDQELLHVAYNAHEGAEDAAIWAIYDYLRKQQDLDALMCLSDPEWRWETRSWLSSAIVEAASEVLDEKLEALVSS